MTAEAARTSGGRLGVSFTLFTLLMIAVAVGLGVWQLQRLSWKENLIADLQARSSGPAEALPPGAFDEEAMLYRPYRLEGRLYPERSLNLLSRLNAGQPGRHIVTPLELEDGRVVLLDRGWVPLDWAPTGSSAPRDVTIDALVRRGGWRGSEWLKPANDPAGNAWVWLDLPAMAEAVGLPDVETALYFSARAEQEPGPYPLGGRTRVTLKNDHLEYALTWFGLALTFCVTYIVLKRRRAAPDS